MKGTNKLRDYGCLECGKIVKVPLIEPYEGQEKPTGIWLSNQYFESVGVLCWECASKLCNEGIIGIGGGYGLEPDAVLMKSWNFGHIENLLDQEENDR